MCYVSPVWSMGRFMVIFQFYHSIFCLPDPLVNDNLICFDFLWSNREMIMILTTPLLYIKHLHPHLFEDTCAPPGACKFTSNYKASPIDLKCKFSSVDKPLQK